MNYTNSSRIARMLRHRAEVSDFRQANAKRRRAFWDGAIRYDNPLKDENGDNQEDRSLSDRGRGAAIIRSLGLEPEWLVEFNNVMGSLTGTDLKVGYALLFDLRPAKVARRAGVSRPTVYRVLRMLRGKLARAHELWVRGE